MVTVIIAQFTDAQEATNFLLRAIDPSVAGFVGDFAEPLTAPPMHNGVPFPYPYTVGRPPASPEGAAAHDMQAMSGTQQDQEVENAALNGEAIVPPGVGGQPTPPNPATDLDAMPRTVPTPPPNTPVDPNGF